MSMAPKELAIDSIEQTLERFPRTRFAHLPTPFESMPRLTEAFGGPPLWVKRDDCTGLAVGGNKTRKLEFLVGAAIAEGAETLLSFGALQSNHVRQTAAAAAKAGLRCRLVLVDKVQYREPAYETSGNVLLDDLLGADVHIVKNDAEAASVARKLLDEEAAAGRGVYAIPTGGSNAVGALGYVDCAKEIVAQSRERGVAVGSVVTAVSSAGTQAGLSAGFAALGADVRVLGLNVYNEDFADQEQTLRRLTTDVLASLGVEPANPPHLEIRHEFLGEGYGIPNAGVVDAVRCAAECEGLLLDPVYSGKAMAGLRTMVEAGEFGEIGADAVVFLHTGGTPGLFAYRDALVAI
jgi:L-cysteate sulfo-lyase